MPPQPADALARARLVGHALRLVTASVIFGVLSGTVSVIAGLQDSSLGVFAVGLGVLADVTGSAVLIWRLRAERPHHGPSGTREARAAAILAAALAVVAALPAADSVAALISASPPPTS